MQLDPAEGRDSDDKCTERPVQLDHCSRRSQVSYHTNSSREVLIPARKIINHELEVSQIAFRFLIKTTKPWSSAFIKDEPTHIFCTTKLRSDFSSIYQLGSRDKTHTYITHTSEKSTPHLTVTKLTQCASSGAPSPSERLGLSNI